MESSGGCTRYTKSLNAQVEGEEACALFRMSPRARTAMRTDSSWSARAMAGQLRAMGGGREEMEGSGGVRRGTKMCWGCAPMDLSTNTHARSDSPQKHMHLAARSLSRAPPSPHSILSPLPRSPPHSAPALTHPVGLDVARDGLEGTRDIRIKRSTLPTQLYTYTHNRRATAADIQQPPIQYPAHNNTVRDNQRQGARKAGGARRAQARRC